MRSFSFGLSPSHVNVLRRNRGSLVHVTAAPGTRVEEEAEEEGVWPDGEERADWLGKVSDKVKGGNNAAVPPHTPPPPPRKGALRSPTLNLHLCSQTVAQEPAHLQVQRSKPLYPGCTCEPRRERCRAPSRTTRRI
ncbi:unnamed protein product [Pleuronectes platessa]|uniref:Uncharacterized protein n=1 Tax=Pleuronectes platessa TaxID=8262 RepID=A0A9N7TIS8_PLEPL|nr:unnamed protein product [Pleuronectes platessa]